MKLPKWLVVLLSVFAVASGLLILAGILLGESWDLQGQATAYHVVDGNTLELDVDGQRIRMDLALVDPPPPDSYHGQKAIEFLKKKVQQFRQDGHDDHFFYLKKTKNGYAGEILYGTQTTSLNEDLIKEGLARVVIPPNEDWTDVKIDAYLIAQKEAQRHKRGIWAHKGYVTKNGFDSEIGKQILQAHEAAKRRAQQEAEARKRQRIEEEKAYRRQIEQALDKVKQSDERIAFIRYREDPSERGDKHYTIFVDVYVKEQAWADMTNSRKLSLVATSYKNIQQSLKGLKYTRKEQPAYVEYYSDTAEDLLARKKLIRFKGSDWLILR